MTVPVAVSGANFAVAETGTTVVVESEGNGRFCTTLPEVLITVMGIEKVIPEFRDLEVMLQLLPRSSTGERMNPYTSLWTGVHDGDGPREFHLVLLDNGRTDVLADEVGRQALHCIRCSACLNACPVYTRTGGHAYESVYPGPIGAILTPQLRGLGAAPTLPWASSLCGACYEVCPVKIDIPSVLVHLRGRVVREERSRLDPERAAMRAMGAVFASRAALRARAAPRAPGPRAGGEAARRAAVGVDRHARPAGDPGAELSRLVAVAAVTGDARDVVLARVRAALGDRLRRRRRAARSRAPTGRRARRRDRRTCSWSASASGWASTARACIAPRRRRSTTSWRACWPAAACSSRRRRRARCTAARRSATTRR